MNEIDTSVQSRLTRLSVRRTLLFVLLTQVLYTVLYAFVLNPLYRMSCIRMRGGWI